MAKAKQLPPRHRRNSSPRNLRTKISFLTRNRPPNRMRLPEHASAEENNPVIKYFSNCVYLNFYIERTYFVLESVNAGIHTSKQRHGEQVD